MDLKPIYFLHYLSSFISDRTCNLCTFRSQIKGAIYLFHIYFTSYLFIVYLFKIMHMLIHRDEVKEEALLLLVGDWIKSADSTLVDNILFGLLPYFFLYRHSHMTAVRLSVTVSKSVLAAQHPLLSGMKDFVKKKGSMLAVV